VQTALRAAHAHYEAKFGHAFLLALDLTDPGEVLDATMASLRERLGNDEDEEAVVTADQLRRICRARLTRLATCGRPVAGESGTPGSPDRAGSLTPAPPRGPEPTGRRYDGRGRWTVPGRA
jgi:2-oxo-4-hydroxy-4-carboxy-5-ureidoimidazoline decarboxylase